MELCLEEANYSRQPIQSFYLAGCGFSRPVLHRPPAPRPIPPATSHRSSFALQRVL